MFNEKLWLNRKKILCFEKKRKRERDKIKTNERDENDKTNLVFQKSKHTKYKHLVNSNWIFICSTIKSNSHNHIHWSTYFSSKILRICRFYQNLFPFEIRILISFVFSVRPLPKYLMCPRLSVTWKLETNESFTNFFSLI